MRIAFVLAGGLHPSGREQTTPTILNLLQRLAQRHEVNAFTLRHLPERASYVLRGIRVHDLGRPRDHAPFGRWSESRQLRGALESHGPFDVLHGYQADPGVLAAWAGRRLGIPSVVTCDSGEFVAAPDIGYGMQRSLRTRALVATACRLATQVHVATGFMESLAKARGHRVICIPLGVNLDSSTPRSAIASGPPWKLLNVASINPVKDHKTLLEALAVVARDHDVHLDIVGEDTLSGSMQAYARQLALADRITFHGYRPFDELQTFYHDAHLYVHASRHEAAGAVFMEAAAHGLPIVSTRVGYASDWAPEGALIVEPANATALALAIAATLQDERRRAHLAATARAFAVTHDADWTAGELERLYASL
jgi:glycosyltransferase involved in cell wall biosynthesis